ncbi:MAG: GNAT family N-acetyltransferase [Selenomonadaceae bacterium]|nr:GNAT family N-acetyltransferase [Selenomonadaceae bacterium]
MAEVRKMCQMDRAIVVDMMRRFYNSPALITNGSEEIFASNVDNCLSNSPYVEGFVFTVEEKVIGYGMLAKSFSTEFGSECVWIEDIYIEQEYRGQGIGSMFIQYVKGIYPDKVLRLEAESDNAKAIAAYEKNGFQKLPYMELVLTRR